MNVCARSEYVRCACSFRVGSFRDFCPVLSTRVQALTAPASRPMVESFELEVPFVRTDDNIADFFTKPLNARKFYAMRRIIMNER